MFGRNTAPANDVKNQKLTIRNRRFNEEVAEFDENESIAVLKKNVHSASLSLEINTFFSSFYYRPQKRFTGYAV